MEEFLPSYMIQARMETSKEDDGVVMFEVVRWWLLLQAI